MSIHYYNSIGARERFVLSLAGASINGGNPLATGDATLFWMADGTTAKSKNNQALVPLNPDTDWILPRTGEHSRYEVQVIATGDPLTGSSTGSFMPANANYFWTLSSAAASASAILTVTVREISNVLNTATAPYTLNVNNI